NGAEWVAVFYGCMLRGVAVVPMDAAASPEFTATVFDQVSAKLLVRSASLALPSRRVAGPGELVLESLREQLRAPASAMPQIEASRGDIAQIVFTSGTTAEPKGVVLTHGNIL